MSKEQGSAPDMPSGEAVRAYYQDCLNRIEAGEPAWVQRTFGDAPRIIEYIDGWYCVRGAVVADRQGGYSAYGSENGRVDYEHPIVSGGVPLMKAAEFVIGQLEHDLRKRPRVLQ